MQHQILDFCNDAFNHLTFLVSLFELGSGIRTGRLLNASRGRCFPGMPRETPPKPPGLGTPCPRISGRRRDEASTPCQQCPDRLLLFGVTAATRAESFHFQFRVDYTGTWIQGSQVSRIQSVTHAFGPFHTLTRYTTYFSRMKMYFVTSAQLHRYIQIHRIFCDVASLTQF